VQEVCDCYGMNRDAFYKYRKRSVRRKTVEEKVVALVQNERKQQPRIGSRKLHFTLQKQFISQDIKVGRDRLFDILRDNKMLIRRKRAYTKTTNSFHRFYKYKNLIKDLEITRPNQVWVADITYIRTQKGFCYLSLITVLSLGNWLSLSLRLYDKSCMLGDYHVRFCERNGETPCSYLTVSWHSMFGEKSPYLHL